MRNEISPKPKTGPGKYLLAFALCVVSFLVIENILPKGVYTAPLCLVVFIAAAVIIYLMLKKVYNRCQFILTETEFYITSAIGHKEHIDISLPLTAVKKLYAVGEISAESEARISTFGAEGEGYSGVLFYDETMKCDRIAKFSVSKDFFEEFSKKLLDK